MFSLREWLVAKVRRARKGAATKKARKKRVYTVFEDLFRVFWSARVVSRGTIAEAGDDVLAE